MSETTTTPSTIEQPQAETSVTNEEKVLERLSRDFGGETVKTLEPPKTETTSPAETTENATSTESTAEETEALKTKAKGLGLEETATKEQIEAAETAKADTEWKLDEVVKSPEEENDGTWKGLIETFELGEVPADYSEEKGFEVVQDLFNKKLDAVKNEALSEAKFDRYVDVPENIRPEAEMIVELMKSGQTIEQITAPLLELAQYEAMSKEELVRSYLLGKNKGDEEVANLLMEEAVANGKVDVYHKAAKIELDNIKQSLNGQRQQQVEIYKNNQKQIQEQRTNQENLKLKVALDRVPEFLGKKLPDNLKSQLAGELQTEAYRNMPGTPEQKVKYFLFNKFGDTAMKNFQDRALEKVVVEHKQNIHNVPIKETGNANRVEPTSTKSVAEQRLEKEYGNK